MSTSSIPKKNPIKKLNVGDTVGRLTILEIIPGFLRYNKSPVVKKARCLCDCGREVIKGYHSIKSGRLRSCGCFKREREHGLRGSTEYKSWDCMKQRCSNKKVPRYERYGGRGIKVCDRWNDSFMAFLSDMGKKPTKRHSIDRINNDGDYTPENCRWATPEEQAANMSTTKPVFRNICATCGVYYRASPCTKGKTKYCSWRCRFPGPRKQPLAKGIDKVCIHCGAIFKVKTSRKNTAKYCSWKCRYPNK